MASQSLSNLKDSVSTVEAIRIPRSWPASLKKVSKKFHHVTVTGTVEFHDYETWEADEHGVFGYRQETNLATDDTSTTLLTWKQGFGGEERVEFEVTGSLRNDGVLSATINVRFYEGDTEGTTELEDSRVHQAIIPPGQTSNFSIHLRNDEDDWATLRGSIGNRRV